MQKKLLQNISILYVEEDSDVREFTSEVLKFLFKKIFIASTHKDAFNIYKENEKDIDLIITDVKIPKTNNLEMIEKIKKINQKIPIILISTYNENSFFDYAIKMGITHYIMKPLDLYRLISVIIKITQSEIISKKIIADKLYENKNTSKLKKMINKLNTPILIYQDSKLIQVNTKLLEYMNISCIEDFNSKYKNFYDLLEDGFDSKLKENLIQQNDYLTYLSNMMEIEQVGKISKDIFTIHINNANDKNIFVLSLNDISNFKEESKLLDYHLNYDNATGLYNQNIFKEICDKEIRRSKRYKNELSLIAFTVDYNKTEIILNDILSIITDNLREHDIISRDKDNKLFFILLPETKISGANRVIEKIQKNIKNKNIKLNFGITSLEEEQDENTFITKAVLSIS